MIEIPRIKELTHQPRPGMVWSERAADYNTIYHNKELGTVSFLFVGSWVEQ